MNCAEFDDLHSYGDPSYTGMQEYILDKTKACPACGVRIERGPGCFHVECSSCTHEFYWKCLANWHAVQNNSEAHHTGWYLREAGIHLAQIAGTDLGHAIGMLR